MHPPHVSKMWRLVRERGIDAETLKRTEDGQVIYVDWMPPVSLSALSALPVEAKVYRYGFRLEWAERVKEWWIDGTGPGMRGFVPVEGPINIPSPTELAIGRLGRMLATALAEREPL